MSKYLCMKHVMKMCCKYEVGCLMWYLALDRVMGLYPLNCTSVSWVSYMLGWLMMFHIYVYWFIWYSAWFWLNYGFCHALMIFMHREHTSYMCFVLTHVSSLFRKYCRFRPLKYLEAKERRLGLDFPCFGRSSSSRMTPPTLP